MKKTRKIIALVLALAFIFCFMAMSASAATTEIQPRANCAWCGAPSEAFDSEEDYTYTERPVSSCKNANTEHKHTTAKKYIVSKCRVCKNQIRSLVKTTITCPFGPL